MNKSELFKAAHKLAKSVIKSGDNYRVTFGAAIKEILGGLVMTTKSIADQIIAAGGKVWEKGDMKRIYMTCAQFNAVTGREYSLSDNNNKIFYDFAASAIMRSYKGKKPTVETQY